MYLEELILKKLSRSPNSDDFSANTTGPDPGDVLGLLKQEYPNFSELVTSKRVVDFGCGEGKQSLALHKEQNCFVCGIDTNENTLARAKKLGKENNIDDSQVLFCSKVSDDLTGTFDIVISQNAMEHFPDPVSALLEMKKLISKDGKLLITFGPPWYAPYGSHMHFFCRAPYINIFFSEKAVMNVRSNYRSDGAKRYVDVVSGLNKMSLKKFNHIVKECDLKFDSLEYRFVKGQTWLGKIPFLKELFVNHVTAVLSVS